jgi:drug/metabolite transporter (DMT)-like permease
VGTIGYLGTVLTQVLAVVVLHEATSPLQVAGSAMVLAAGLVLTLGAVRARAVQPAPAPPR